MAVSKATEYVTNPDVIPVNSSTGGDTLDTSLDSRMVWVPTISDMLNLDEDKLIPGQAIFVKSYSESTNGAGGGVFRWVESYPEDENNFTVWESPTSGKFVRQDDLGGLNCTHYGIAPGNNITEADLQAYFDVCDELAISAKFTSGEFFVSGNFNIPILGMSGQGRYETTLWVDYQTSGAVFYYGNEDPGNDFFATRGNIGNLTVRATRDSERDFTGDMLTLDTPNRGVMLENLYIHCGGGVGVNLIYSFYLWFHNCVFEGPFQGGLPTTDAEALVGIGVTQDPGQEINNITFTKCEWKYLKTCVFGEESAFEISNNILFDGCVFEFCGDRMFNIPGWEVRFDSCYFERVLRNQNTPSFSETLAIANTGAGRVSMVNTLINVDGIPDNTSLFQGIVNYIKMDGGSINNLDGTSNVTVIAPNTFSTRGIFIDDGMRWSETHFPSRAIERPLQQTSGVYPSSGKQQELFTPLVVDSTYSKNTLQAVSLPTSAVFGLPNYQGVFSVEGRVNTHVTAVTSEVELVRWSPTENQAGFRRYRVRFVIDEDMPSTITPSVELIDAVNDSVGFNETSASLAGKFEVQRRTSARSGSSPYTFHYQVVIVGESGDSVTRSASKMVDFTIMWIYSSDSSDREPQYGVYQMGTTATAP